MQPADLPKVGLRGDFHDDVITEGPSERTQGSAHPRANAENEDTAAVGATNYRRH